MKLRIKPLAYIACGIGLPLILSACGSDSIQDVSVPQRVAVSGLALDGYVARARV